MTKVIDPRKLELLELLEKKAEHRRTHQLEFYEPYDKQKEFHAAGKSIRERLFMAGNQLGKTISGGAEVAMHVTGMYPDWWPGRVHKKPTTWWVSGVSGESTRDNPQRILLGNIGQFGTGMLPKEQIIDIRMGRGVSDAVDTIIVRHKTGGESIIQFKSYEKGREKWQGMTLTGGLWFDEEPPMDVYSEGLTRTNAENAMVFITFTPLLGMSDVVSRFLNPRETDPKRAVINMTIEDVAHYSEEDKQNIIAAYPEHEREARAKGIPMLGSGRIFPVAEAILSEEAFDFPAHWPAICGLDFGWDHPTAAVWARWDRDDDVIHIYDTYRMSEQTPIIHAAAIRARGAWIPTSWPHDGLQHDKGSGEQLADLYRQQGVNMLPERAQYADDRGHGVEAGLMDMLQRMQTGRWKVAEHLKDWWEEYRMYHRKDGRVVKERDDLMAASRYLTMMLRYASTHSGFRYHSGKIDYPNLGIV